MARAAGQTTLSARHALERTDGRRVLVMGEPELTPGRKVRGGSGRRVAATSPGAVRRAASGVPGSGSGRRLPAMSPLTQAAVGLGVSAPSRAAPCVTFSVGPRQELGAARAGGSIVGSGLGSWGPGAQGAPLPAVTHSPTTLSLFLSGVSWLGGHLAPATRSPPLRPGAASPPAGLWHLVAALRPLPRLSLAPRHLLNRLCPSLSPSLPLPPPPPPSGTRSPPRPRLAREPELPPPAARRELPTRSTRPASETFAPPHT